MAVASDVGWAAELAVPRVARLATLWARGTAARSAEHWGNREGQNVIPRDCKTVKKSNSWSHLRVGELSTQTQTLKQKNKLPSMGGLLLRLVARLLRRIDGRQICGRYSWLH